ncbi:hypothetical protein Golob_004626, partial [Gossypium lobatum]|nr:hypothetical protein [Gossypium lobatum]
MVDFNPSKPFPSMVLTWIHFSGLSGFLYNKQILEKIRSLVRKVTKLDIKTDSGARGQFSRMAIFVDLEKSLTSQEEFTTMAKRSTLTTSDETFGPWMIVELKSRQSQARLEGEQVEFMGTRFQKGQFLKQLKGKNVGPKDG